MAAPVVSNFPTTLDDVNSLANDQKNLKSWVLSGALNNTALTIPTTATISGITAPFFIRMDTEIVWVTSISGADFVVSSRGDDGTTAASHADQAVIYHVAAANLFNQLRRAIIAIQTALGANLGKIQRTPSINVTDPNGAALTTGDGKAYFRVPATLNGFNLVAVGMHVTTVSSSGIPTVQIANVTDGVDMLSTKLTVDANEKDSITAAVAAVIDTTKDDVVEGDELRIDVDVAGTGTKGLIVDLTFQAP